MGTSELKPTVRDIFCFSYGVVVFWGFEEEEELRFLKDIKPFEHLPQDPPEREIMSFSFGIRQKIEEEEIVLPDTNTFSRLAISHGLALSVKLATFDNALAKTINTTR